MLSQRPQQIPHYAYERLADELARQVRTGTLAPGERIPSVAARFPEGTRLSRPRGGFLLWVRLPDGADALTLHAWARARGISLSPGPIFSPSGGFRNFVRLSAGHPWSERTAVAVDELARFTARSAAASGGTTPG